MPNEWLEILKAAGILGALFFVVILLDLRAGLRRAQKQGWDEEKRWMKDSLHRDCE